MMKDGIVWASLPLLLGISFPEDVVLFSSVEKCSFLLSLYWLWSDTSLMHSCFFETLSLDVLLSNVSLVVECRNRSVQYACRLGRVELGSSKVSRWSRCVTVTVVS